MTRAKTPRRARTEKLHARTSWWMVGAVASGVAMLLYILGLVRDEGTERGLIVGPVVVLLAAPLVGRIRLRETRFDLAGIVFAALGVKLMAVYARWWMVNVLYDGSGDSTGYHVFGAQIAPMLRRFDFASVPTEQVPGTGYMRILTGVVYAIFGADAFTGFMIYSLFSFLGCWFFYRAFAAAVPEGDHKRYAILVFFWPSLMFWPSATGKEAWMLLCLGLVSWGAANVYRHLAHGYPLLALGILGAAMPRPHIAIVVLASAAVGLLTASLFGAGAGGRKVGSAGKLVGVVFIIIAGSLLAPKVATFLQIDDIGGSGFADSLEEVNRRTDQGGSNFDAPEIRTPLDYPLALITVLFRPFPYEVNGPATAISAAEGILLLILMVSSTRKLFRVPAELVRNAYVAYATSFAFMFVYVFAFIANFGILARQRTQMLPFLFVLIALPTAVARARRVGQPFRHVEQESVVVKRHRPVHTPPSLSPPRAR